MQSKMSNFHDAGTYFYFNENFINFSGHILIPNVWFFGLKVPPLSLHPFFPCVCVWLVRYPNNGGCNLEIGFIRGQDRNVRERQTSQYFTLLIIFLGSN